LVLARPLAAFVGAAATLVILFRLARVRGRTGSVALLLVGVILNAIDSAIILCLLTTGDPSRFQSVIFFLVGSIASIPGLALSGVAVLLLGGLVVLVAMSHRLNLIALGEETAGHLGVPVERTLWISLIAASLVTAAAVAFAGLVGFVGLIVPHLLRTLLGPDHRLLIPASVLAGAAFLVFADTIARTVIAPVEIPVGAITALLGGPLFLTLFLRKIRQG
jgi:iron complex transport system permease protein